MGIAYLGTNIICGINSVNVFFHTQSMSRPAHLVCLPCSLTCYMSALSLYTILLSLTHSHIYTHYHTPIRTSKQHSSSTRKYLSMTLRHRVLYQERNASPYCHQLVLIPKANGAESYKVKGFPTLMQSIHNVIFFYWKFSWIYLAKRTQISQEKKRKRKKNKLTRSAIISGTQKPPCVWHGPSRAGRLTVHLAFDVRGKTPAK